MNEERDEEGRRGGGKKGRREEGEEGRRGGGEEERRERGEEGKKMYHSTSHCRLQGTDQLHRYANQCMVA